MATITIRNLRDEVKDELRVQAARKGRSLEAEAREVLEKGLERPKVDQKKLDKLLERVRTQLRAANGGVLPNLVDDLIAERRAEAAKELAEFERYGK
jgi:plasmid stability protein